MLRPATPVMWTEPRLAPQEGVLPCWEAGLLLLGLQLMLGPWQQQPVDLPARRLPTFGSVLCPQPCSPVRLTAPWQLLPLLPVPGVRVALSWPPLHGRRMWMQAARIHSHLSQLPHAWSSLPPWLTASPRPPRPRHLACSHTLLHVEVQ